MYKFVIFTFLTTVISALILLYLHEYQTSTFVQLTTLYPPLTLQIHSIFSKWFAVKTKDRSKIKGKDVLFTEEELKKHSEPENGLYLAILGKVFDVSSSRGKKYYGPGGSYHFFTGRDASRAFITGDFTESGLTDDVEGLTSQELLGLEDWVQLYRKDYKYKGKLIGRYYTASGEPTPYNHNVRKLMREAKNDKENNNEQKLLYPPCNAEWSQDSGSRVWCSEMSGGIQRDWVGVPRQLYEPKSKTYRCACINEKQLEMEKSKVKEYQDCHPKATSCWVYTDQ